MGDFGAVFFFFSGRCSRGGGRGNEALDGAHCVTGRSRFFCRAPRGFRRRTFSEAPKASVLRFGRRSARGLGYTAQTFAAKWRPKGCASAKYFNLKPSKLDAVPRRRFLEEARMSVKPVGICSFLFAMRFSLSWSGLCWMARFSFSSPPL